MKPCAHRDCHTAARWRIVGKPIITCDEHRPAALKRWPGAQVVPLPQATHFQHDEPQQ